MSHNSTIGNFFLGVAHKLLSSVEVNPTRSNQHEFNGVSALRTLLGGEKRTLPTKFLWVGDGDESFSEEGFLTWYDARERHPTRTEYRLYFSTNEVMSEAVEGDQFFLGLRKNGTALVVIAPADSTVGRQLHWLFGTTSQQSELFEVHEYEEHAGSPDFAETLILDELEIDALEPEGETLDQFIEAYEEFPSTAEMSRIARESLQDMDPRDDPDDVLTKWMQREEALFRRLERKIIAKKLRGDFLTSDDPDVDGLLKFSSSALNRRKSRAGYALEHHLAVVFSHFELKFERNAKTENRARPARPNTTI